MGKGRVAFLLLSSSAYEGGAKRAVEFGEAHRKKREETKKTKNRKKRGKRREG